MCFLPSVTQIQQNTSSTVGCAVHTHSLSHTHTDTVAMLSGMFFYHYFPWSDFHPFICCFVSTINTINTGLVWLALVEATMMMMTSLNWITVIKNFAQQMAIWKNVRTDGILYTEKTSQQFSDGSVCKCVSKWCRTSMIWILHLCA